MVTITDLMAAWRRERQVVARVSRAAWRLEQAGRERARALASARAEEVSIRTLAAAAGLSPPGVPDHGRRGPGRAGRRAARAAGRGLARPRRPGGDDDAELDGRDLICGCLVDEVGWLRRCVGWLTGPHTKESPPVVNWRCEGGHPGRADVVVDLSRVAAIVRRVGAHTAHLPGCTLSASRRKSGFLLQRVRHLALTGREGGVRRWARARTRRRAPAGPGASCGRAQACRTRQRAALHGQSARPPLRQALRKLGPTEASRTWTATSPSVIVPPTQPGRQRRG